jgi:hypothetical protein
VTFSVRAALRVPFTLFFLAAAAFGTLSHIRFTYLQFLRHQLLKPIELFVTFHQYLFWAAFLLGLLSVVDDLKRRLAVAFALAGVSAGVLLSQQPVLTTLESDDRSLVFGLVALVPPLWLALIDLSSTGFALPSGPAVRRTTGRLVVSALVTSCYVWITFAAIGVALRQMAVSAISWREYATGLAWSLGMHLAAGSALLAVLLISQSARSKRTQYWLLVSLMAAVTASMLLQVVFPSIAFHGMRSVATACIFGVWSAIVWSGLVARKAAANSATDVIETFLEPLTAGRGQAWALGAVSLAAYVVIARIATFDWHFLLQTLLAAAVWVAGFALIYQWVGTWRLSRTLSLSAAVLMMASVSTVLAAASIRNEHSTVSIAVDRYGAYDASLTLVERFMKRGSSELADLTTFLVANSDLPASRLVKPASIDFAKPLARSDARKPHIFLFSIDSLRRDYLSVYNPAVTFTPAIQAFARESVTFENAFTRYGGTGLSEPAIWSGALLPHRQYVTPFAPMNALEKLLDADGYDRLISVDSILRELLTPSMRTRELNKGVQNRLYDTCQTFEEIRTAVEERAVGRGVHTSDAGITAPLFVFSQPQDLHLANVAIDRSEIPAGSYAGFHHHYAARLRRFDRCFGGFIEFLKTSGVYDNSIIILTSDHGDSLGDEGRWGHAFTVFPEIVRIPLIVHVPVWLRRGAVDPTAVAVSTDITPTLYKLLGHEPAHHEPLFGHALIGADADQTACRRSTPYLLISSYGPVYGLLTDNGRDLYILDGVNTAEYQYDLRQGLNGSRTSVTEGHRRMAHAEIRRQVESIAAFYAYR